MDADERGCCSGVSLVGALCLHKKNGSVWNAAVVESRCLAVVGLPIHADGGGEAPAAVVAAAVAVVVRVGVLDAVLPLELVPVEVGVHAGVELMHFVAACADEVFLVAAEADAVGIGAGHVGVTADHLEGVVDVVEGHDGEAPDVVAVEGLGVGEIGPEVVLSLIPLSGEGVDLFVVVGAHLVGLVVVDDVEFDEGVVEIETVVEVVGHGAEVEVFFVEDIVELIAVVVGKDAA